VTGAVSSIPGHPRPAPADKFADDDASGVSAAPYPFDTCRLASFLTLTRRTLTREIMAAVRVDTLHQENMCCLNTALILLRSAFRAGSLGHALVADCCSSCPLSQ
jgi:uncharacterized protein DUF3689